MLNENEVDRVRKRVNEIIKDYACDEDESYVYISMYFETSDGRSQHKRLILGKPSKETPDDCRDLPHGYLDGLEDCDGLTVLSAKELLFHNTTWTNLNGEVWNGLPLTEIRKLRQKGE